MIDKHIQGMKEKYELNVEDVAHVKIPDPEQHTDVLWRMTSKNIVDSFGKAVKDTWILNCAVSASNLPQSAVREAIEFKSAVQTDIRSFFEKFDYFITPTVHVLPEKPADQKRPVLSEKLADFSWNPYTYIFNWSNNAALSLSCGTYVTDTLEQLPLG